MQRTAEKKCGDVMADLTKRVRENVSGDFFVDSTCIDCDACRQIAPAVFSQAAETSYVSYQPDHLYWNREQQQLGAFRDYCWHSWEVQRNSMRKLTQFSFEWILPGHGQRVRFPASTMAEQMAQLVDRM